MIRLSALFVAICMGLIAASLCAVLYLGFGLTAAESAVIALTALTGLAVFEAVSTRARGRGDFSRQIADLSHGVADLARQVGEYGRMRSALEKRADAALDKATAATRPLTAEIAELSVLVHELAQSAAAHEAMLRELSGRPAVPAPPPPAAPEAIDIVELVARPAAAEPRPPPIGGDGARAAEPGAWPVKRARDAMLVASVREAIEANRIEIYLQPVVALPQRKVRFYEALARVRTADGAVLAPAEFLEPVEAAGLMPRIDGAMVLSCARVLRRLMAKNRDVGLFCNLSASTLADQEIFAQIVDFLAGNRALAGLLFFEFAHPAYRAMGPREHECLAALAALGFRFSIDHVGDLRFEPRDLADRSCAFVKIPAPLLLAGGGQASDIDPADLASLLSRYGIELVAEKIENEASVLDLLDFDVRFGQGFLFSPPRPVRSEVMSAGEPAPAEPAEPAPERTPALARLAGSAGRG